MATITNQSRPAHQTSVPQQTPKGWLRRALEAVQEAVSGPQIAPQSGPRGADRYTAANVPEVNSVRSLAKFCSSGKGGNTQVLRAMSQAYYIGLCKEISEYSETPAPARPTAPTTRR